MQTETKIYRHELSVALAKARLFRCFQTHLEDNLYQKKSKVEKKKKNTKNIEEHKNVTIDSIL